MHHIFKLSIHDDAAKRPPPQALLFMGSHFLKHCARMSLPLVSVKFRVHVHVKSML